MKQIFTKNRLRIFTLLLLVALMMPILGQGTVMSVSAAPTQEEIDQLKDEAWAMEQKQKALQNELNAIASDKSQAMKQKSNLEQQIQILQDEIDNISAQIDQYALLIAQKELDIASAEADEQRQYDLFCARVRAMEEGGEDNYWSILFSAADFSDLLDRFIMVEEIMAYDNGVMDTLIAMREALEVQHTDLETSKQEREDIFAQQSEAQATLRQRESEVDVLIAEISSQEDILEAAEREMLAAADEMDDMIAQKEKELEEWLAAQNPIVSEKGFIWPVPTSYNLITSLFGGRIHPITGKYNNHSGIDLAVPGGEDIYAAKSGVVTMSEYHSGYGYFCVISHANGESTLYAHQCRMPIVKVGEYVTQGQVIGYIGTTGSSSGNHLHYEIRVDGVRKDPVDYYPEFTLYLLSGGQRVLLPH